LGRDEFPFDCYDGIAGSTFVHELNGGKDLRGGGEGVACFYGAVDRDADEGALVTGSKNRGRDAPAGGGGGVVFEDYGMVKPHAGIGVGVFAVGVFKTPSSFRDEAVGARGWDGEHVVAHFMTSAGCGNVERAIFGADALGFVFGEELGLDGLSLEA